MLLLLLFLLLMMMMMMAMMIMTMMMMMLEKFSFVDWSFTYIRVILMMGGFLKPECLVWADLNDTLYISPVRRNFLCFS